MENQLVGHYIADRTGHIVVNDEIHHQHFDGH